VTCKIKLEEEEEFRLTVQNKIKINDGRDFNKLDQYTRDLEAHRCQKRKGFFRAIAQR